MGRLARFIHFYTDSNNGSGPEPTPAYKTVTGQIVNFLTRRIAPLKIEAELEPIQDLHGYDAPWPAGGGKNILPVPYPHMSSSVNGIERTTDSNGVIYVTGKYTGTSSSVSLPLFSSSNSIPFENGSYIVSAKCNSQTTAYLRFTPNSGDTTTELPFNTDSSTITITGGIFYSLGLRIPKAEAQAGVDLTIYPMIRLASVADDTWEPYENICPISGHTEAMVYRTGKNLYDKTDASIVTNYYINTASKINSSTNTKSVVIPCNPNTTYTVSKIAGSRFAIGYVKEYPSGGVLCYAVETDNTSSALTITTGDDAAYLVAYVWYKTLDEANISLEDMLASVQIELGSTASAYESYDGTSVTLTFGQTVYGGKLTVNEDGTGSVKARPYYASYNGETLVGPWVSSMDAYAPGTTPTIGAQVVDMGGAETTITLTPGQVNALLGNNTVWVDDSDSISVTYRSN